MSSSDIVVPKLLPTKPRPESFDGRVKALAQEYRRVADRVWPKYTEVFGESGIGAIAADVHATPASPNFLLYAAYAASRRLEARIANSQEQPPTDSEAMVIRKFCELDNAGSLDFSLLEYAIGYVLVRQGTYRQLEEEISYNHPRLIQVWHQMATPNGRPEVVDPRTWLYSQPAAYEPETPIPAPKPRIIN